MVRIVVKSMKMDAVVEAEERAEAKAKGEAKGEATVTPQPTHGLASIIRHVSETNPDEALEVDGKPTTITPSIIRNVIEGLPDQMSPAGFTLLVVNIMAAYDLLSRSPQVLFCLIEGLKEMKEESPILFEEEGLAKLIAQYESRVKRN